MEREVFIYLLIYIHALLGGLALVVGGLALFAQKGSRSHKKYGLIFFYAMLFSALLALVISVLPGHESYFLFTVGLFSTYFIISGYRSLQFKRIRPESFDKSLPLLFSLTGAVMIVLPYALDQVINMVMLVFGSFAIVFGIRDFLTITNHKKVRKVWLRMHLGNMMGGYIAAATAFLVVNNVFPGIWSWFIPGLVGGVYIAFWNKKISRKHEMQKANA